MGAPIPKLEPVDNGTAEALLSSLEGMAAVERRKHASIFNYWLSIRGDRQFPPIRDLDPLEISDAGPWSVLLEMIGAGENAVIRHLGQAIKLGVEAETISRAPNPSLLACIHAKLPAIASSMQAVAFEDSFETDSGKRHCWVTLLPFSASGTWIDYVYAFVSLDTGEAKAAEEAAVSADRAQQPAEELESFQVPLRPVDPDPATGEADLPPADLAFDTGEPDAGPESEVETEAEPELEPLAEIEAAFEPEATEPEFEPLPSVEPAIEPQPEAVLELGDEPMAEMDSLAEPEGEVEAEPQTMLASETAEEPLPEGDQAAPSAKAGFSSKFLESLASVGGFYGRVVHAAPGNTGDEPISDDVSDPIGEPICDEISDSVDDAPSDEMSDPVEAIVTEEMVEPTCKTEGTLQSKLTEVRAMAEEARQALLRSELALYAGLSAAYDFALDAEDEPEEYLRLVEGQGLKIQLRSPMKPVVKLAFAETCDETTICQLEAVLAWALKQDLPRGSLAERIEAEGGIGAILDGFGKAA